MSDFDELINASDLIEWIMETYPDWCIGDIRSIVDHIYNMPTQTNTFNALETLDCISRKAAVDALHTRFRDGFDGDRFWNSTHVLAAIKELPSAQPEIIRCKDCKHYKTDHPRANGYHCCYRMHNIFPMKPDDFCSHAERREDGTP